MGELLVIVKWLFHHVPVYGLKDLGVLHSKAIQEFLKRYVEQV